MIDAAQVCRECLCTDGDCRECMYRTGARCWWFEPGLCSACAPARPFLIVGEQPNNAIVTRMPELVMRPDDTGIQHSANRLLEFSGWERELYLDSFDRCNLVRDHRGGWPTAKARLTALDIVARESGRSVLRPAQARHVVVLLGARVRAAFSLADVPLFQVTTARPSEGSPRGFTFVAIPHPSGLSRAWNDQANVDRCRELFEELRPIAEERRSANADRILRGPLWKLRP